MSKFFGNTKAIIILIAIISLLIGGVSYYRSRSTKLLDRSVYSEFRSGIEEKGESEEGGFVSQEDLRTYIRTWADRYQLEYSEDKAGNIIFDRPAVSRKKNVTPTLICVSMNYETAVENSRLLSAAASIAFSDVEAGRKTVVFANDEQNLGQGYKKLGKDFISSKSKVIYLDYGSSSYLSASSFEERLSEITVPAKRAENKCDTAVRISISNIKSGVIGPGIAKQPDPISAFSTLLTRLKSKSVIYGLSDVSVTANGNMYPTAIEATITLNSYAAGSFTSYIDKRIKAWDKAYGSDYEGLEYTYELIEDQDSLPETVYSNETTDSLAGVLYMVKSGTYRYSENDSIPEGRDAGDTYGINCLLDLSSDDSAIKIRLLTQGFNKSFTDRIIHDNKAAAELYGCAYSTTASVEPFLNERDSLSRTFMKTYMKVNDISSADAELRVESDNYFTPCSYLANKSSKSDIIHIRINASSATRIANTLLCYIKTKGNTSFF